jgi:hypothetical protein
MSLLLFSSSPLSSSLFSSFSSHLLLSSSPFLVFSFSHLPFSPSPFLISFSHLLFSSLHGELVGKKRR